MLISKNIANPFDVDEFARNKGYILPVDFESFLKKYNGGDTPNTSIKTQNVSSDVRAFYGIGDGIEYSLDKSDEIDKNGSIYLPIAVDSYGNNFVIDVTDNTGVFFVDHEKSRELEFVTDSFKSFIELCESEPIKEASKRTPEEREDIMVKKGKADNITDGLRKMWQEEYNKYSKMIQEEVVIK